MGKVVAIDGPSGAGKSTIARAVADALGFEYLDTGALYRAIALYLRRNGISPDAPDEVIAGHLGRVDVRFDGGRVFLNGEDVSEEIRSKEVGHYSSVFSARGVVRNFLLPLQRKMAVEKDLVAEGRDMTTVVFPDAWRKFFLDASPAERARRRFEQMREKGRPISMDEAIEDVLERDRRDSSREIAPLSRADDAIYMDTTELSPEEVIARILASAGN